MNQFFLWMKNDHFYQENLSLDFKEPRFFYDFLNPLIEN